jgi:hypothetical protein
METAQNRAGDDLAGAYTTVTDLTAAFAWPAPFPLRSYCCVPGGSSLG